MSFCVTTEMGWPVYVEGEDLFCLLCKKHDTSNPQNNSTVFNKEPCKRFHPQEFEDHYRTSQHMNAVSAEMLQRVSVFKRTLDERERVAEDVRIGSWKNSYLTTRSSHMWAPELTCIPGLAGFAFCLLLYRLAVRISLPFHIFLQV